MNYDLDTLKAIKDSFNLCSDSSTNCIGYKNLCKLIDSIENANQTPLIKTVFDLRTFFHNCRFDEDLHLGLGDIRLSVGLQDEICDLMDRFYILKNYKGKK